MGLRGRAPRSHAYYAPELRDGFLTPRVVRGALLAVAAAVVLGVGIGVGRATAGPAAAPQAAATTTTSSSTVTTSTAGPTHTRSGVGIGFTQSRDGALAAATTFSSVLAGPLLADPDRYQAAIQVLVTPAARPAMIEQADRNQAAVDKAYGLSANALLGTTVVVRTTPLAWHLDSYSDTAAQVSIWQQTLVAIDGKLQPTLVWATGTYQLQWVDGDWRLAADSSSDGPVPLTTQQGTGQTVLPAPLRDYREYATDAHA